MYFLKIKSLLVIICSFSLIACAQKSSDTKKPLIDFEIYATLQDSLIFEEVMTEFRLSGDTLSNLSSRIMSVAEFFAGTEYVASTLELEGEERLVVNLREMDCTTFVEYVLAMACCQFSGRMDIDDFYRNLALIRYRQGKPEGYLSRLHYFTEWLKVKEKQGSLILISDSIGNEAFNSEVHFMSTNPGFYRQLEANPEYVFPLQRIEGRIAGYSMKYLTKDIIKDKELHINNGDIIAFVTTIEGLDVSHTGFAMHHNDRLHLLHASTRSNKVELTPVPLHEYLAGLPRVSGILVGRVVDCKSLLSD
ncbi:N-acetylmuramoyl-L-alanine amidase-like domain-containing protein [Alkalitalea saponilacus]|uniref:DUF1460 domain-containing protein n=1 Tax=Alkalitalea saponilacus TaxID=889453 RepID=A0A1T5HSZ4_9BACT|nr:N-acetylmuramoyl-L-alanine amidase-like domain-containing protein [Alkalitalea saponilacus]ASB47670.1 hypothetical protein CDL62_00130 [Alkalitalea saponilacus]SKC23813.1 Protein of unknown function [Alkalitalea saponilacus]